MHAKRQSYRLPWDAGIAIGPILFVVLILGILAAAIAASGGSFTSNTQQESARSNAAAMVQIGLLLKSGFSRLIGVGIDFDNINIDVTSTTNDNDLFSPSGGSVATAPSVTLANNPAVDVWRFPLAALPQLGTSATERLAMLKMPLATCNQINLSVNALSTSADDASMGADIGDVGTATLAGAASWPTPLVGKEIGCIRNTNATTPGYFYFQVLGVR